MKATQKDSEKFIWDEMRSPTSAPIAAGGASTHNRALPKLLVWLILFVSVTYIVYTLKLVSTSRNCKDGPFSTQHLSSSSTIHALPKINVTTASASRRSIRFRNRTIITSIRESQESRNQTDLRHVVFGIAASAKLWEQRKNYIKLWYKPKEMKGIVWLDEKVKTYDNDGLPPVKISADTSKFPYKNKQGHPSAIRISRIVSETLRLGLKDVRWFVMGDDDTVFVTDNLLRVLRKYDHNQYYYIGSLSESHLQNIFFSYSMAYGGGGFAISYPLAQALSKMQDRCIHRYPGLYGSDDRMQACMAELGVPLTKELGFHQVRSLFTTYFSFLWFFFFLLFSLCFSVIICWLWLISQLCLLIFLTFCRQCRIFCGSKLPYFLFSLSPNPASYGLYGTRSQGANLPFYPSYWYFVPCEWVNKWSGLVSVTFAIIFLIVS